MGARYSHSRLGLFRECPQKYSFKYVHKVEVPRRISADIFMGAAVHAALRKLYELAQDNVIMKKDDLIRVYRDEWEKPDQQYIEVSRDMLTVEDYIANGEAMLSRHYDTYHPFNRGKIIAVEENLNFELPDSRIAFIARIDLLWKRQDGAVELADFKTGRHLPHGPRDPGFFDQMALYQIGVKASFPQFQEIDVAQYFLKHDEVVSGHFEEDELDAFAAGVRQEVMAVERSVETDNFPTREGAHCHWCEFARLCPARRHRFILAEEEGADKEELATAENASRLAERYIQLHGQARQAKDELEALKEDLVQISQELGFERVEGKSGSVSVKTSREETFATKSDDIKQFLKLTDYLREWGMDECFTIDRTALKKMFQKRQFSPEQLELLTQFVVEKSNSRVTVRLNSADEGSDENSGTE